MTGRHSDSPRHHAGHRRTSVLSLIARILGERPIAQPVSAAADPAAARIDALLAPLVVGP
ncbi:hypothetical protein [Nocardia sp. NPDC052566]|uniref:hypothetical protein n=1 Tax=Nocardia sp. NPDC052566 TaxID=3364330 RepID=UPI0037CA8FA2